LICGWMSVCLSMFSWGGTPTALRGRECVEFH
jgi:hypothetical protein